MMKKQTRRTFLGTAAGKFTNCPEANAFLQAPARGAFSMKDFA